MSLPIVACPCCNVQIPLEVWLAHTATREAFLTLAELHPGLRLPKTALRYVGLFAPAKRTLRWERIADLLREVAELVNSGRVAWKHQDLPAPMDYWLTGMESLLAKEDLRRPLSNHNLLKAIVASYSEQAQAGAEQARITSGRGETPRSAGVSPAFTAKAGETPALQTPPRTREGTATGLKNLKDVLAGMSSLSPHSPGA